MRLLNSLDDMYLLMKDNVEELKNRKTDNWIHFLLVIKVILNKYF